VPDSAEWLLEEFLPRLYVWAEDEGVDDAMINQVRAWVLTRYDDPYQGAVRARTPDGAYFDNLWFVQVPGTLRDGRMVTCTFRILENDRIVSCDGFATLSLPI
jgi:hypothetical protein